jgi:hypothetical protein
MKPWRWVRWKVVTVLAVAIAAFYFLGLDKMALSKINQAGDGSRAARWSITDVALGILAGDVRLQDLQVATVRKPEAAAGAGEAKEEVFHTAAADLDISVYEFLKGRYVVDQMELSAPRMKMVRRADGTVNAGDLGGPPEEPPAETKPARSPRDWYESLKKWHERIEKVRKWVPSRTSKERKPGFTADYSRAATYPFEGRPSFVVRKIAGSNLEIELRDESSAQPLPPLKNGKLEIRELTSSPTVQAEPTELDLSGDLGGTPLAIKGTVDLRGGKGLFSLNAETGDLPASLVAALVGESLPVNLKTGSVSLRARVLLDGEDRLEVVPRLAFKKLQLEPKDPRGKLAGFDAAQFTTAFNEAAGELEEVVIEDLKITGSLSAPRFEWGDTVKNLVVSGGKAFARKQAEKGLEKGREALGKELDKLPVGKDVKEKLKDVDLKSIEKGLPGLQGIFGEKKEKPPEEPRK